MRRILAPAVVGLAVLGFAACSPDEGDFASEAEDFIGEEDGDVATETGMTFSDVQCEEPSDTDTGTTFTCTATGSDGISYLFTNQIAGDKEFQVLGFEPTTGDTSGSAPTGSAPVGSAPVEATATTTAST